ncbi:MAG TPA: hypothetical protein VN787_04340, partial [Steroidobacteraceae bacterium]|nr:hypothetical protein [Steroidobacteraceae bacterium]
MQHHLVSEIAADVAGGRRTAEQAAAEALSRASAYDAVQPQAWIHRVADDAVRASARRVDRRL